MVPDVVVVVVVTAGVGWVSVLFSSVAVVKQEENFEIAVAVAVPMHVSVPDPRRGELSDTIIHW